MIIYHEKKNPAGAFIAGVPCRDLTPDEYAALPAHTQAAIKAAPFFTVPPPPKPAPAPVAPAPEPKEN